MAELVLPMIFTPLHRYHPEIVGRMWLAVWKSLTTDRARQIAWPYTVNDLLLGTEWEDPTQKLALYELVSRVDVGPGVALLESLEAMGALQEDRMATDVFHAPAPLLYPVHKVLLKSLAAENTAICCTSVCPTSAPTSCRTCWSGSWASTPPDKIAADVEGNFLLHRDIVSAASFLDKHIGLVAI